MAAKSFTVNLGIKDLQRQLTRITEYDTATQVKLRGIVQTSTTNIMLGAKRRAPVRSGRLIKGISSKYDGAKNTGLVRARSPHAHLVEYGARGAIVVPGQKLALRIGDEYAAHATIPARKEHPFLRPAFEDEKPHLVRNTAAAINP